MEIHVARGDQRLGIFSPEEVRQKLASGELRTNDLAWTEDLTNWVPLGSLPLPANQPPPLASSTPLPPALPPTGAAAGQTSPLAVVSLVSGILSFAALPFICALPAIICGHIARSQIKAAAGRIGGSGLALAGLILGYANLAILPLIAILLGIALPVFGEVRNRASQTQTMSQLRQVALAAQLYALDHGDKFPDRLADLVPEQLPDATLLTDKRSNRPFIYYGGTMKDPPKKVLIESPAPTKKGARIVAFVDGSVDANFRGGPPGTGL